MSVLVDTGVFYAHHDRDAARHDAAVDAMNALLDGTFGQPYATEYVYDEPVTLTRTRTGSFSAAKTVSDRIRGTGRYPDVFDLLQVGRDAFERTMAVWTEYDEHDLSVTDADLIATCDRRDVDAVVSFDDDFDGLVDRIDPATVSDRR